MAHCDTETKRHSSSVRFKRLTDITVANVIYHIFQAENASMAKESYRRALRARGSRTPWVVPGPRLTGQIPQAKRARRANAQMRGATGSAMEAAKSAQPAACDVGQRGGRAYQRERHA